MRVYFLLLLLCLSATVTAQTKKQVSSAKKQVSFAKSLFWKVTPPNTNKASYIYGTMHVSQKIAFNLPDTFYSAIKACDFVALESDPEYWLQDLAQDSAYKDLVIYTTVGVTKPAPHFGYFGSVLNYAPLRRGDVQEILLYKPREINALMFRKWGGNQNLQENTYLDLFIFKAGKRYGKPIKSLEPIVASSILATRAGLAAQKANLQKERQYYNYNYAQQELTIDDAYRLRDIDLLDSLNKKMIQVPDYLKFFLYYRNDSMVNSLVRFNQQGKTVFCAVGAAHLAGVEGMLYKLQQLGYKVEPVMFSDNFNPAIKIDELSNQYVPVTFSTRFTADSSIKFIAPTYTDRNAFTRQTVYLSSELNNGIYYMLSRTNNPSMLNAQSSDAQLRLFDSLLFENTEGSVQNKQRLIVSGYPAMRVESKTQDDRLIYQQVISTPLELIYQKVDGKDTFVQKQNGKQFLEDITIKYNTAIRSTREAGYTKDIDVRMPVSIANEGKADLDLKGVNLLLQGLDGNGNYYLLVRTATLDQESSKIIDEDTFHLAMFAEALADRIDAQLLNSEIKLFKGMPSLRSSYNLANGNKAQAIFFTKGCNVYALITTNKLNADAETFFNSVTVYKEDAQNYYRNSDSLLGFTYVATTKPLGDAATRLYISDVGTELGEPDNYGRKWMYGAFHHNQDYGYQISVIINELSSFEAWQNIDSFWSGIKRRYDDHEGKRIYNEVRVNEAGNRYLDMSYAADSASSIMYRRRCVLHNQYLAVITSTCDTSTSRVTMHDTLYNSFRFTTKEEYPLFALSGKLDTLKRLAYAEDSSSSRKLRVNVKYMDVLPNEQVAFARFLDTSSAIFNNDNINVTTILQDLDFKNDSMLVYAEKLYAKPDEDGKIQETILQELAEEKTPKCIQLYKRLLLEEPPLSEDANYGLSMLADSSLLAKQLYPEILQLLDYDDYKQDVIDLSLDLLADSTIDSTMLEERLAVFMQYLKRGYRTAAVQTSNIDDYYKQLNLDESEDDAFARKKTSPTTIAYHNGASSVKNYDRFYDDLSSSITAHLGSRRTRYRKNDYTEIFLPIDTSLFEDVSNMLSNDVRLLAKMSEYLPLLKQKKSVLDLRAKLDTCSIIEYRLYKALKNVQNGKSADMAVVDSYFTLPGYKPYLVNFFRLYNPKLFAKQMPKTQQDWALMQVRAELNDRLFKEPKFVKKVWCYNKYGSGYVYVFKYRSRPTDEVDAYAYSGFFDADPKQIFNRVIYVEDDLTLPKSVTEQMWLQSLPMRLRVLPQKSISVKDVRAYDKASEADDYFNHSEFPSLPHDR